MKTIDANAIIAHATPVAHQEGHEIQPFGRLVRMPIALAQGTCVESIENLNQLLADTIILRDMYKKHHWQVAGATFYQLHLLFDKHHTEQDELVDAIAERIHLLGGVSVAMAHDVSETTLIPRAPTGREEATAQISRLLHAHEIVLKEARTMARRAAEAGDDGTNDLIVSDVIRRNELQAWFIAEHVVVHVPIEGNVKGAKVDTFMSTIDRIGIRHVDVERTTVISAQPFDVVVSKLAAAIGHPDMSSFARAVAAARTSADLEGVVNAVIGSAGLTEMARFDIGEVLRKELGDDAPKAMRLVMGNPLIMKEMVKHVPDAASYAPVTVLIDERPDGVHLSYDLMASLLAPYGDAEALAVARQLDDKVMALLTAAAE